MSSQRSPRYPLRSHDFPMNPDLVASPRASIQLRSRALEGSSQNTMPSIVNHTPNAVTDFHYASKTYFENGSFGNSQNILDWQDLQDPSLLLHDTHQNRTNFNHSAPHFNSPFGMSTPEDVTDQSVWNYDDSHGPPAPPFSYSEYSDAFSVGSDADLKPVLQATTQPSTSSPYMNRSQHRQSHLAMTNYPQANRSALSIPRQEYSGLYPESELYQNCLIAPRLQPSTPLKNESSATNSPSIINNYEYDSSPAVGFDDGSDAEGSVNAEPYAQLIYRALKSVPGHGMVLKEIYDWFEKNTDKARNTSSKGWQNSIRHNLSMNGAFRKVEQSQPADDSKKGFIWVLEQCALEDGVKSTTRYRKTNSKKTNKAEAPAPQRQRSGAKGGKAARKTAKLRRVTRPDVPRTFRHHERLPLDASTPVVEDRHTMKDESFFPQESMPYYLHTPNPPATPLIADVSTYGFPDIVGCAPGTSNDPLFYDSLDTTDSPMLPCHPFCDSEDNLLSCGLGCIE